MTRLNNISVQPLLLRTNSENQVVIYAKQYDNNLRELLVDVRDFFGRVPPDISVRLNATLKDGSHVYLDGVVNNDDTVSIMLTNLILAEEGDVNCDVSFINASGDMLLTTETFVIKVDASNYDPAAADAGQGTPIPVVYVRYDVEQDLTDEQKATARHNIGVMEDIPFIEQGTGEHSAVVNSTKKTVDSGYENIASGDYSYAEGGRRPDEVETESPKTYPQTTASGAFSHAEGASTLASGNYSHAQNNHTKALHKDSDAGGTSTITGRPQQTVRGKFNAVDENALFVIGNGTSDSNRKNAFAVNADGTAKVQKQVVVEGGDPTEDNQLTRKAYVDKKLVYFEVPTYLNDAESFPFGDSESLIYLYGSSASNAKGEFIYYIDEETDLVFPSQITRIVNGEFDLIDTSGRIVTFYLDYEHHITDYFIGDKPATESYVATYAVPKTTLTYKVYGTNQNGAQVALDFAAGSAAANSIARRTSGGQLVVADPTANGHAATKKYVDEAIQAALGNAIGGSY